MFDTNHARNAYHEYELLDHVLLHEDRKVVELLVHFVDHAMQVLERDVVLYTLPIGDDHHAIGDADI